LYAFNVLRKFATIRGRPSEAVLLFQLIALQSSWRSLTRNQRSGLSFAVRQLSCFAHAAQWNNAASCQSSEIRMPILLEI